MNYTLPFGLCTTPLPNGERKEDDEEYGVYKNLKKIRAEMSFAYKELVAGEATWRGSLSGHVETTWRLSRLKGGYTLLMPLLFGAVLAVGISWSLVLSAASQSAITAVRIDETANDVAALFATTVRKAVIPVYVVRALARSQRSNFSTILGDYDSIAQEALDASQGACSVVGVAPNGRVLVQYPLKGNEKSIGHDLFVKADQYGSYQGVTYKYPNRRTDSLKVVAERDVYVTNPQDLVQGYRGMFARLAVFVDGVYANETSVSDCDIECYNSETREVVWGIVSGILRWDSVGSIFSEKLSSFRFKLSSGSTTILQSEDQVSGDDFEGISVKNINVFNLRWQLVVEPKSTTLVPDWRDPVIAATCFASIAVALMIQLIMVQKTQKRELLLSILPKYALKALQKGQDASREFECACLLFTDIVDFTALSAESSALDVSVLLHELYSVFDRIADQHGVYKIETIGDSLFLCTGAPSPGASRESDATSLAKVAIDLVNAVASFQCSNGIKVEIRIGMHCGPVVGTIMGKKCPRFCLVGDTVNTSSRMESTSEPMKIQVSRDLAQLLYAAADDSLLLERRGVIAVKGKGNMETFWLTSAASGDENIFLDSDSAAEGVNAIDRS